MSVINQMLRDLDARDASAQERAGLPPRLRSLPPTAKARNAQWRTLLLGMGIGAVVAGGAVGLLMEGRQATESVPVIVAAPTVAPPPQLQPPPQPIEDGAMKLSTLIAPTADTAPSSLPSLKSAPAAPKAPMPSKPHASVEPTTSPKPVAAMREAKQQPAPVASETTVEAQIDKRSKGGAGREMAEAEYRKGMQAVKRGEPSVTLFQRAIEFDPTHARARQALLSVLVSSKQWTEARQVAEQGLELDPAQSGWAVILARLQFEQGEAAAATATLERYAAHARNDADFQGLFAYLLQKQQRPVEAAERFKAALSLRPNEGRWWFGLGVALESAGHGGEAKEAYARAREVGNLPGDMAGIVEQKLR
jgi:MSHA biogenesis protein MshN